MRFSAMPPSSPLFCPFFSCPSLVLRRSFASPSVSSSPPFLIPPSSSSSFVARPHRRGAISRAPPFYLRIVRKAIPYSSFVTLFFLSHCPLASLLSRHTLTPSDSLPLLSFSLSLSFPRKLHASILILDSTTACNIVPAIVPDNDCYRLMRVCILARIHVSTRGSLVSRRIQSATRSAGTRDEEGRARWQPGHRKMRDALFASIFGTILK